VLRPYLRQSGLLQMYAKTLGTCKSVKKSQHLHIGTKKAYLCTHMKFEELELIDPILKALKDKNYEEPTPIQEKAIPLILQRKDILGCAQTGTGKTAAFSIPIIQLIHKIDGNHKGKPKLRSLIVTPTRELAIQIDESISDYSKYTNLKHTVIYGGVKQMKQVKRIQSGIHVLVATPGRLLDLIGQGIFNLNDIKMFVLDEADRMLDMGFINDIRKLIRLLPQKRQNLFFSATMPDNIVELSKTILNDPKKIEVTPVSSTAETIQQYIYYTNRIDKRDLLLYLLKEKIDDQVLLFSRTKHGADKIVRFLQKEKVKAAAIHGNKSQNQRQKALNDFKDGKIKLLVATDIAARGIDIDKLQYVINFSIPNIAETYVHRIGRSGRAGNEGVAISISEAEDNIYVKDIQKLIKNKAKVVSDHPFPQTDKPMTAKEKKEFNKLKQERKMEMIAARRKKRSGGGGGGRYGNKGGKSSSGRGKSAGNSNAKTRRKR